MNYAKHVQIRQDNALPNDVVDFRIGTESYRYPLTRLSEWQLGEILQQLMQERPQLSDNRIHIQAFVSGENYVAYREHQFITFKGSELTLLERLPNDYSAKQITLRSRIFPLKFHRLIDSKETGAAQPEKFEILFDNGSWTWSGYVLDIDEHGDNAGIKDATIQITVTGGQIIEIRKEE